MGILTITYSQILPTVRNARMAGIELMDTDAPTDFGAVSKLQLGWYIRSADSDL